MNKYILYIITTSMISLISLNLSAQNNESKQFKFSTTIEKERPELNETTKKLISTWRKDPSAKNLENLRKQVEINYDKVIERKKAKLEELKKTAKHSSKVKEMQEIVDEVIQSRESRIEQSMKRFTDSRLKPGARETKDGFLPIIGLAENISIAYAPVTNEDYSKFIKETGKKAPADWKKENFLQNNATLPVVNVSFKDANEYCKWLSNKNIGTIYRLPSEQEWEFAAGHMPKDADFNCGKKAGITPIDTYKKTLSACGAIDMWGNCWEWTSTATTKDKNLMIIKGGSWSSPRMNCRTEYKDESRNSTEYYNDLGFRIVREEIAKPKTDSTSKPQRRKPINRDK